MWTDMADPWSGNKWRIILLFLGLVFIWMIDYDHPGDFSLCIFRNITGHPCYGCGLLKGISALLHGDFSKVCQYNKLNLVTIPLLSLEFLKEMFRSVKNNSGNLHLPGK